MKRSLVCLSLAGALLVAEGRAEDSMKPRGWSDSARLTKRNIVFTVDGGGLVRVDVLGQRLFRIRHSRTGQWTESGLNRYGIFTAVFPEAASTGYPVMRAMSLAYPDDPAWDAIRTQYMLGDFFLVSAFAKEVRLPEGTCIDFFSGKHLRGPATLPVEITPYQEAGYGLSSRSS